jgi:hypothetical protein
MTDPITPPPELVQQWMAEFYGTVVAPSEATTDIATRAAQWGADQELEACCEWLCTGYADIASRLRAARHPKPLSLKEQALEALDEEQAELSIQNYKLIRAVLEALPE